MKVFGVVYLLILFLSGSNEKTRQLEYNGSKVMTTYEVDTKFIGNGT